MKVIVKAVLWDAEGDRYLSYAPVDFVKYEFRANRGAAVEFDRCIAAWRALASTEGVGNVKSAELVEVGL